MPETHAPNVAAALLRIHSIITRGLRVAADSSQSLARDGCSDANTQEGFINYVKSLVSVLDAHHQTEDQLAFPYFRDKIPDAPFDLLTDQHRSLVSILDQVKIDIDGANVLTSEFLSKLHQSLRRIEELFQPHIRTEETYFTVDKIGELIGPEEHIRLIKLFGEHSQQHSGPDYLVVPFLLHNLQPLERAAFAGELPPIVTQQLVPVVWREKWEPMKPFLLP